MMSGRGQRDVSSHKPKLRRFKAKHQRKRFMRAKDPVLAVFMWGVQHTVSNLCVCRVCGTYCVLYIYKHARFNISA